MAENISEWFQQCRTWKSIEIDNRVYVTCSVKENRTWKVLLTDLVEIWMETLTHETIFHKCQTLNPLLDLKVFDWEQPIIDMLNDVPKYIVEASMYQIKLQMDKGFVKLKFSLDLSKGTPQQLWESVTMPLCLSSKELIHQHEILLDLVKRKDEEIAEYKAEGAELIRKYIATKPFNEELFQTVFTEPAAIDFARTFQSLLHFYKTISLPKLHTKAEPEIPANDISDNDIPMDSKIDENMQEFQFPNSSANVSVQKIEQDRESSKNKESHLRNEENECKANSSTDKAPVRKISSLSHAIQKSLKKNKKGLNNFIS